AGGVEVGLADLEVDHVPAGRLERTGTCRGLEGGLGPDPLHAVSKLHASCLAVRWVMSVPMVGSAAPVSAGPLSADLGLLIVSSPGGRREGVDMNLINTDGLALIGPGSE